MTKLTLEDVEQIAHLARLTFSDEEKITLQDQLSTILDYAEKLRTLDTENIIPTTSALPLSNVMRKDVAQPGLSIDEALSNAPDAEDDSFHVLPVLE